MPQKMDQIWIFWTCLCIFMTTASTNAFNLTILHTNDIHARIEEMNKYNGMCSTSDAAQGKCYGGMERMKTKVNELRSQYPNSLLLDGGDQFQGTLLFYVYGGQIMSHLMNILGYDAMSLGNHEFDLGPSGLVQFLNNATFPVLSSNIDVSKTTGLSSISKSTILDVAGEKVGIVGYTTTDTTIISRPGKITFLDEIESIQAAVDLLKDQGVNKIIALGHAGFTKDLAIAQEVRGLDIIVGGHTNTFLYNGQAPSNNDPVGDYPTVKRNPDGDRVLVVQDYAFGKYLGFLQVDFDDQGNITSWNGNPILLDKTVPKDGEVTKVIQSYMPEVERIKRDKVGTAFVTLDGDSTRCRVQECNMGNLMADAAVRQNLRFADSTKWNHVSIALFNSGGIRASIPKGDITTSDILSVAPFRHTVDIVMLRGDIIKKILEHSVSKWTRTGNLFGGFLQISGLRVVYDMRQNVGSRVVRVQAMCTECLIPKFESLNSTKTYKVLLPSFLVGGGDGYTMIRDNHNGTHIIGDVDTELLLNYITDNSPITTGLDGRIQFLEDIEGSLHCTDDSTTLQSFTLFILCSSSIIVSFVR